VKSLFAAILALSCSLFVASCAQSQSPELPTELDDAQASTGEPAEETEESIVKVHFDPSDFPFVTTVPDDGEGYGGGWQVARANLDFWKVVIPRLPRHWKCPLVVEMPLRTRFMGPVPPKQAEYSVEIAEAVARTMSYDLPRELFCKEFVDGMKGLFALKYDKLGARVKKAP
jgi:hypothetical protein